MPMLRSFFIYLSRASWAQRWIPGISFVRWMATRFVAGETADEALRIVQELNQRGINSTLDYLGENTTSIEDARKAAREVEVLLSAISQAGLRSNVSVKLSQLGLTIDPELCRENLRAILGRAKSLGNFVRIDMEDSSLTDLTLEQYFSARQQGFDEVGIVIQAYLYRSEADIRRIQEIQGKIRLCKGAYREPGEVAYPKKASVDAAYDRLAGLMLEGALKIKTPYLSPDGLIPPPVALATHDENRIKAAQEAAHRLGIAQDGLEFQFLYGIRRDLQERLVKEKYPVRVYVPYGAHWYPYFMRRLAERPANVWFLLSNLLRR